MSGPRERKPPESVRRRNAPEPWTALPEVCRIPAPKWPAFLPKPTAGMRSYWLVLWKNSVAAWWHDQNTDHAVVARYVEMRLSTPTHASVAKLENDLGLTPLALVKLRLVVERPEPVEGAEVSRYRHLRVAEEE